MYSGKFFQNKKEHRLCILRVKIYMLRCITQNIDQCLWGVRGIWYICMWYSICMLYTTATDRTLAIKIRKKICTFYILILVGSNMCAHKKYDSWVSPNWVKSNGRQPLQLPTRVVHACHLYQLTATLFFFGQHLLMFNLYNIIILYPCPEDWFKNKSTFLFTLQ